MEVDERNKYSLLKAIQEFKGLVAATVSATAALTLVRVGEFLLATLLADFFCGEELESMIGTEDCKEGA